MSAHTGAGRRPPEPSAGQVADRYGRRPKRDSRRARAVPVVAATVVLLLTSAGLGWLAWQYSERTSGRMLSYRVLSDREVEITWSVHRDPARRTECVLRARNRAGVEIGRMPLVLPPGGPDTVTGTDRLPTRDRAVTGEIQDCHSVP